MVDDEQDITFTLKETLEETGLFQIETFTDPISALSEFKASVYDLAVLDIRMPEMNGFQLCRKLRDMDNRLKICFLTATELLYYQETDSD
ncbi:MAG TPA: response regulator, partial [Nitrososphaeraceae archaeon]|nr:response regulator [Nitrososphaeraceae archaeon]